MSAGLASHDPRVVSVFEIVAAHFVDVFFNHIYHSARVAVAGGASLTDEYVRRAQAYMLGAKNDQQCYAGIVQGLHAFFTSSTRYTTLSFAEFVDRVVGACVPEEYFRQFTTDDKDEILGNILCDLVAGLAAHVAQPEILRRVIDGHAAAPEVTVRMLQDAAVQALIAHRGRIRARFLSEAGQARDTVPARVVADMKDAIRRLTKDKVAAVARATAAEAALRESAAREAKLRRLVDLMRAPAMSSSRAALPPSRAPLPPRAPTRAPPPPQESRPAASPPIDLGFFQAAVVNRPTASIEELRSEPSSDAESGEAESGVAQNTGNGGIAQGAATRERTTLEMLEDPDFDM